LIGVSTHRPEEVAVAAKDGADFAVFGPVYDPLSKGTYGPATGLTALTDAVKAANAMPLYALGGITAPRIEEIAALPSDSRPSGVAAIGAVFGTTTPGVAVHEMLHALLRL
jgi:thiamine monophosphate synthase